MRHRLTRLLLAGMLSTIVAACSTPMSLPVSLPMKKTSGFLAKDNPDITGSVDGIVSSPSLRALLGDQRWLKARDAISLALRESEDGDTVSWRDDGRGGSVTPIRTFSDEARQDCRALAILDLDSDAGELLYDACRDPSGIWRVAPMAAIEG